jgi:hypothetical protein
MRSRHFGRFPVARSIWIVVASMTVSLVNAGSAFAFDDPILTGSDYGLKIKSNDASWTDGKPFLVTLTYSPPTGASNLFEQFVSAQMVFSYIIPTAATTVGQPTTGTEHTTIWKALKIQKNPDNTIDITFQAVCPIMDKDANHAAGHATPDGTGKRIIMLTAIGTDTSVNPPVYKQRTFRVSDDNSDLKPPPNANGVTTETK